MPKDSELTADQIQLLASIEALLVDGESAITVPLTAINKTIAGLNTQSSRALAKIEGQLLKSIQQHAVTSDNQIDALGLAILKPLQDWQEQNNLLLTQLAASSGLTQPGDDLDAALLTQAQEQPELAYSATLLMALRDFRPLFAELVEVLKEIRDRLPNAPVHVPGEPLASAEAFEDHLPLPADLPPEIEGNW